MVANFCNNLYNHSIFLFVKFHDVYSNVFIIYYFLFPVLFSSNLHPLSTLLLYQSYSYSIVFIIYYFLFPVLFQPSSLIHLTPLSILSYPLIFCSYLFLSSRSSYHIHFHSSLCSPIFSLLHFFSSLFFSTLS